MVKEKILTYVRHALAQGYSPACIAQAVSVGVFIAFSPYIFFHTIMIFLLSWMFGLNVMITFVVTYAINNPWTMFIVYAVDYLVGDYILNLTGFAPLMMNPSWMEIINEPLRIHTGMNGIAFWSFMIGGNLLGVFLGVMMYPIVKKACFCLNLKSR